MPGIADLSADEVREEAWKGVRAKLFQPFPEILRDSPRGAVLGDEKGSPSKEGGKAS